MKKLETVTAEQLQSAPYAPVPFLVEELLPEGLHILAGAPKIGKSWLALWLCLCVSQGRPLWNFAVTQGEVLYLSLEDSYAARLCNRRRASGTARLSRAREHCPHRAV